VVGLAEAERVEVLERVWAVDLKQKSAGVPAIAATGGRLLQNRHPRAGVLRGDRGRRAGRTEPDNQGIYL
jgi:hypothetical protein